MSNTFCRKSVYLAIFSTIATFHSFAQEKNDFFKDILKDSFKDLLMESLKPETMMMDSLFGNIKLEMNLNKEFPIFIEKQPLKISENLFKPYTNPSKPPPSRTASFNTITNKITFFDEQLPSSGGNIGGSDLDINAALTKLFFGKEIYPKLDYKYTETEKQAIIEKTNQLIRESRATKEE